MTKLEGNVAFIAGSAKGIGKAIAECFAAVAVHSFETSHLHQAA
jgi:NAD(P)-dependent dehydrogenase (short-subunit alcohol dehydrogenase family)